MSKKFLFIANVWLILTMLLGIIAVSGCFIAPDGGGDRHDDDHHADHGPAQRGDDDHHDDPGH